MSSTPNQKSNAQNVKQYLLVMRCQVGDESAFLELYQLFGDRTLRFLNGLVKGPQAEDINQEVWITVYKKISGLSNVQGFRMWLFQIARNEALDYFRKTNRLREFQEALSLVPEIVEDQESSTNNEIDVELTFLRSSLDELPQRHTEVLVLNYLEGMDYEEIGLIVGCSVGTIKSRIHNAKAKLKYLINKKMKRYEHE